MNGPVISNALTPMPLPVAAMGEEPDSEVFASVLGEASAALGTYVTDEAPPGDGGFEGQSPSTGEESDSGSDVTESVRPDSVASTDVTVAPLPTSSGPAATLGFAPASASASGPSLRMPAAPRPQVPTSASTSVESPDGHAPLPSGASSAPRPLEARGEGLQPKPERVAPIETPDPVGSSAPAATSPVAVGNASRPVSESPEGLPPSQSSAPAALPIGGAETSPSEPSSGQTSAADSGQASKVASVTGESPAKAPVESRLPDGEGPTSTSGPERSNTASGVGAETTTQQDSSQNGGFGGTSGQDTGEAAPAARQEVVATNDVTSGQESVAAARVEPAIADATPRPAAANASPRPVPTTETLENILAQVRLQAGRGTNRIEVAVDPPELGPVAIRLILRGDRLVGDIAAESREVAKLLENGLDRLRVTMKEVGVHVDSFEVRTTTDERADGESRLDWNDKETEAREHGYRRTREAMTNTHEEESTPKPKAPVADGSVDVVV